MRSSSAIRGSFLDFFEQRGHTRLPSGPLIPSNDPTLMFANAGMVQFKDVFTGKEARVFERATTAQKCIRISGKHNDLENVGVTTRHHTFFEMLGNFSFGDYFKREAIQHAWTYFTEVLKLDPNRLAVTVFGGEPGLAPADEEAERIWAEVAGLPKERIIRCGAKDNFWQMGDTGPCGPCSEIHYCLGLDEVDPRKFGEEPGEDGRGWFELWNLVFMQFDRQSDGTLKSLPAPSIDTGAGLERIAVVQQGVLSNYDTDLLKPLVSLASEISGKKYTGSLKHDDISMRVIADHARTSAFLISEGVFPDRDGRAYVLRRVMRRAIRHGHRLGIQEPFLHHCAVRAADLMADAYPQLAERRALISDITQQEEERFRRTLARGLQLIDENDEWDSVGGMKRLPGAVAFRLYDTFGFPLDLQEVIGTEQGFSIDHEGFDSQLDVARERSRGSKLGEEAIDASVALMAKGLPETEFCGYDATSATSRVVALLQNGAQAMSATAGDQVALVTERTPFYAEQGGQVADVGVIVASGVEIEVHDVRKPVEGVVVHFGTVKSGSVSPGAAVELRVDTTRRDSTRRNHSATHLLHWALRKIVGSTATQKGSLVGPERLRFDYSGSNALTKEQLATIEQLVNKAVLANTEVVTRVLDMKSAQATGAVGIFEEKYGDVVRVLDIGSSRELCGGTHVSRTGDIGLFRIVSESGLAAGVRRIEAATGLNVLRKMRDVEHRLGALATALKAPEDQVEVRVDRLVAQVRDQQREIERLQQSLASGGSTDLTSEARSIGAARVLATMVELGDAKALRTMADQLRDKLEPAAVLLASKTAAGDGVLLVCSVSKSLTNVCRAGDLIRVAAEAVGGKGGGRPDFAQAGGTDVARLPEAIDAFYSAAAQSLRS